MEIFLENSTSLVALIGVLILILFLLYSKKIKITTKILINISLMIALAIILNYLRIYHFPQGGAVTLGGMIPLILISFRYGSGVGILAGFIFGLITILQDPFILHPVQVLFDYPLPFMAMGLAGIFPKKIFLSVFLAFAGRFACHFISGVIFFSSYAPEGMSPIIYSILSNATYLIPEMIICCIILKFLPIEKFLIAMKD
ncbi:MAG: energy-coupled thiamine transporter ThiT [Selenomonadaceae bacterium]|nr:energy-coupled thiamine transporter ThiT [Selenomonadaceae bacterium]